MNFQNYFQNAYVTRDLDKAIAILKSKYELSEFIYFTPDMIVKTDKEEGLASVRAALGWVGSYQVEVIEPVSGLIHHYLDYLPPDHTLRFHHIAMRTHDWDGLRAEIDRDGWTVAYEGSVPGLNFVYVDCRETLGHYVEYIWATPEMWAATGGR